MHEQLETVHKQLHKLQTENEPDDNSWWSDPDKEFLTVGTGGGLQYIMIETENGVAPDVRTSWGRY